MKKTAALLTLLAAVNIVQARDWENALVTDRPDTAEASVTVGKHRFQLETSFGFEHNVEGGTTTDTYNFPTLLRFGLVEWLELRVESPLGQFQKQSGQTHTQGWNDLEFGFKAHLLDNDGFIPSMGMLAHLAAPTGSNHYSANSYDPTLKWINDWDLPADFSLGTNLGFDLPQNPTGQHFARFLYAASAGHPLPWVPERLRMFTEVQGVVPARSTQPDEHSFDSGFTFLVTPDIQLDTFVQIGLNAATTDVATGLGFSWRAL